MNFQFEINIKESKKAINTADVVCEKLKAATVLFTSNKHGVPMIHVLFEGLNQVIL